LREQTEGPVTRYTTREVLASEMALQRDAQRLAADHSHGLSDGKIAATAAAHTLKPEQADALAQLAGAEGFAILWGEAGTGKSHTLNAVRAAYEAEGVNVMGLSHTNKVVQAMRGGGFTHVNTIDTQLKQIEKGQTHWDRNIPQHRLDRGRSGDGVNRPPCEACRRRPPVRREVDSCR
jgi:hypothetical protein